MAYNGTDPQAAALARYEQDQKAKEMLQTILREIFECEEYIRNKVYDLADDYERLPPHVGLDRARNFLQKLRELSRL